MAFRSRFKYELNDKLIRLDRKPLADSVPRKEKARNGVEIKMLQLFNHRVLSWWSDLCRDVYLFWRK